VVVQLSSAQADVPFLKMVIAEEERTGSRMPLDALIVLARLRKERRLDVQTASAAIQKNESSARAVLERLVEAGLVEGRGATRARTYTLSAQVYQRLGQGADYIRQVGFDPIQQEQMVLQYVRTQGRITRSEAAELCRLSSEQAKRLLTRMEAKGSLVQTGTLKGAYYELAPNI
jgi:ATP-dependent DNA helicase RecG